MAWASFLSAFFAWASASKSCVTSVTKNSWSSGLPCPASPCAIWPICRSSSWTRWSIFGLFSQSCSDVSDVIGLGCCGEGDGLGCASGRRFPSDWRLSRRLSAGSYFSGAVLCRLASGLGSGQGSSAEAAVGGRRHARLDLGARHVSQSPHFAAFGRTIQIARSAFRWRLCNHANVKKHQPRYDYGKGICGKRTLPGRNIGPPWPITFTWSDSFSASFYPTNRGNPDFAGFCPLLTSYSPDWPLLVKHVVAYDSRKAA